jgi:uncharacterized membrane protein
MGGTAIQCISDSRLRLLLSGAFGFASVYGEELRRKSLKIQTLETKLAIFQKQAVRSAVPQKEISPIGFAQQNGVMVGSRTSGQFLNHFSEIILMN